MPARNRTKIYIENGHYHAFNRGVEKRNIFLDDQDYRVFLSFLKVYLSPPEQHFIHPISKVTGSDPVRPRVLGSYFGKVTLLAYCVMPNHFHLLLQQIPKNGMTELIRALCTSYSMYFNKRYKRVGTLFQGTYKAVSVDGDENLLRLSRYIHTNPLELTGEYPYSSFPHYLGKKHAVWVHPEYILAYLRSEQRTTLRGITSYQSFVEDFVEDAAVTLGTIDDRV